MHDSHGGTICEYTAMAEFICEYTSMAEFIFEQILSKEYFARLDQG